MVAGRVRSLSSRSGQASCWPRITETPLQGLKSAGAFLFCTRAGVSGLPAHDEWGGSSFPFRKDILCVQGMGRNDRNSDSRGTVLRNSSDCRLWDKCGSRLGAHTSLSRTRRGGRVFVAIRGI